MQALAKVWISAAEVIPMAPTRIVFEGARQVIGKPVKNQFNTACFIFLPAFGYWALQLLVEICFFHLTRKRKKKQEN